MPVMAPDMFFAELMPRNQRWHGFYKMHFPSVTGLRSPSLVRVEEVVDGEEENPYWGWEAVKEPGRFSLIWCTWVQFNMCFPYGVEASEKAGQGRRVALRVNEILNASETRAAGYLGE